MSKEREALEKLARECGATTYTNRHFPLATAFSFSPMTWEKFCAALAEQPAQQTCNCRWDGETQVQQCTMHAAHVDAIHEWAERAKAAEAKLKSQTAQPQEPLNRMDVACDIKTLCANGDLQDSFEEIADWIASGSMPAQQQEPEDEPQPDGVVMGFTDDGKAIVDHDGLEEGWVLYTSPPASKPWVGLTLTDREKLRDKYEDWNYPSVLLSEVDNILREKNA